MFNETKETKLEILDNGCVNVTIITRYFKNNVEIGNENWGSCLEPHPAHLEYAAEFLDEYYLNILRATWTDEVMATFKAKLSEPKEDGEIMLLSEVETYSAPSKSKPTYSAAMMAKHRK